jgi:glycine/D-amino acid oxidase-like deaminating enzyme
MPATHASAGHTGAPANVPAWDDAPWSPLPALVGNFDTDVCVVGLGGSGLAAVAELRRAGVRVVGLDAARVGSGAAGRNGGLLLAGLADFHHVAARRLGRERAARLYRLTMVEMERVAEELPALVHRTGSLRIAATPAEWDDCAAQLTVMREDGLPVEPYSGPEGEGLLFPLDGSFQPLARVRELALRAMAAGARLFEQSHVLRVRGTMVETAEGRVRCERVIVAVDGRLEQVVPALADRVRTARLQMLATAPLAERRWPRPVYRRWGYDYWQQREDGRLLLGGFRDHEEAAEWTPDSAPSDAVQAHLERFLRDELRVTAPITHRWAASVGFTDTGLPVLEERLPNVWVTGAYSGTGNVVGALCGRAAAELAMTGRSEIAAAFAAD